MILDDFVMLGKTVPEINKADSRLFVCTAGYSLELRRAIRIYPMARINCPTRWSVSQVPLERNPKDSRWESWKIRGDRSVVSHERINDVIASVCPLIPTETKENIVADLLVPSLKEANRRKLSLCTIKPKDPAKLLFSKGAEKDGETEEMLPTKDMFPINDYSLHISVNERFNWHPRLKFSDEEGSHNLMLRDWGCYEFLRKNGDKKREDLNGALYLDANPILFLGNFSQFRNSWLIISVLSGILGRQGRLDL